MGDPPAPFDSDSTYKVTGALSTQDLVSRSDNAGVSRVATPATPVAAGSSVSLTSGGAFAAPLKLASQA